MKLVAEKICKTFGATVALDHVSVTFCSGEVRAVVGENGAGKSSLLKMISRVHNMDSGTVTLDGCAFKARNHIEAAQKGIAYVFQETTVNPYLTVAENVFIDRLRNFRDRFGLIQYKRLFAEAQEIFRKIGVEVDASANTSDLNLGQWKIIEIARALSYDPKVIFFDESTAYLNNEEITSFLSVIKHLKETGLAIGFVSHHMEEIFEIADVMTVMRDGKWIADLVVKDTNIEEVQRLMVGRTIGDIYPTKATEAQLKEAIKVNRLSRGKTLRKVTFDLKQGEILGIGGLKGSGGEEILGILSGDVNEYEGEVIVNNQPYRPSTPADAVKQGVAMVPGERMLEGLIADFSVKDNVNMGAIPRKGLWVDGRAEEAIANDMIVRVSIKADGVNAVCSTLSGGNMQKVVIGKCLATDPNVILLNNPTRGIDVGARHEIYQLIRRLSRQGKSILLLTEDLNELIGLCDRCFIMRRGEISRFYGFGDAPTEESIVSYMI